MLDRIADVFFHPVTQIVITGLFGIAVAGFKKYHDLYKEIIDIGQKYKASISIKSNGGKTITEEEWAAIGKETVEAIEAAGKVDWKSIFKRK